MAVSCKRTKRGSTEGETNGIINYSTEVYEVTGLPVTSGVPLTDPQIVVYAQQAGATPNPLPSLSDPQPITGLPLKRWRVSRSPVSRSRASITLQYGSPRGFGPTLATRRVDTQSLGGTTVRVPLWIDRSITLPAGIAGPTLPIYETMEAEKYLGRYQIAYGRLQETDFDPIAATQTSIQNEMKLYQVNGLPFLHTGIRLEEMADGRYWVWTKYMSTGIIRSFPEDHFIKGSQEVAQLGILEAYRLDFTTKTTVAVPVTELYENGGTLGWAQ